MGGVKLFHPVSFVSWRQDLAWKTGKQITGMIGNKLPAGRVAGVILLSGELVEWAK